jgi:phosphoribosylformylglycinamidine synthase
MKNKAGVIVFPGSNCDRDAFMALEKAGFNAKFLWSSDRENLDDYSLIVVPGGFSHGDYLRCGAMAAKSAIMQEVISFVKKGGRVIGICNGFQILTEAGLLEGVLLRNQNLKFVCKEILLKIENTESDFTKSFHLGDKIKLPIAHHDGNFFASEEVVKKLHNNNQIALTYVSENGYDNPNGSIKNIAGIFNEKKNVLGLMPHPERYIDKFLGGEVGLKFFSGVL